MKEEMQGTCHIYKGGKLICRFSTSRYDSTNKSAPHIQGQIVRQIKRKIIELSADYADVYINYSVFPNGPFCTRVLGSVTP